MKIPLLLDCSVTIIALIFLLFITLMASSTVLPASIETTSFPLVSKRVLTFMVLPPLEYFFLPDFLLRLKCVFLKKTLPHTQPVYVSGKQKKMPQFQFYAIPLKMSGLSLAMPSTPLAIYSLASSFVLIVQTITLKLFSCAFSMSFV